MKTKEFKTDHIMTIIQGIWGLNDNGVFEVQKTVKVNH